MRLHAATLLVRDYDEAIAFFTAYLGFHLAEDGDLGHGKRWVRVTPTPAPDAVGILLARAVGAEQIAAIGKAAGGRVAYFLHTDDFAARHAELRAKGVYFREQPRREAYGMVAVFEDLYGNPWDLVGPGQS